METTHLSRAAEEFRYLLERGYPRESSLKLVGDRHRLESDRRRLLHRAVFDPRQATERRSKLIGPEEAAGQALAVDGCNVLITLESGLENRPLVLADDGVVRDTAGLSWGWRPSQTTTAALDHITRALRELRPPSVTVLLLSAMSGSGRLAEHWEHLLLEAGVNGRCRAEKGVETLLSTLAPVTVTASSPVMDRAERVFDLAGHIIRRVLGRRVEPVGP